MSNAIEISAENFTAERFKHIFEEIFCEGNRPFNSDHFFPIWQQAMCLGLAKVWAVDNSAVLGGFFIRDIFSGVMRASVPFWFALREVRHTGAAGNLMRVFEDHAKAISAVDIQVAAHQNWGPGRRAYQHEQHGFVKTETIYTKTL